MPLRCPRKGVQWRFRMDAGLSRRLQSSGQRGSLKPRQSCSSSPVPVSDARGPGWAGAGAPGPEPDPSKAPDPRGSPLVLTDAQHMER